MICPTCGWENPDYATFCEICKKDLRKELERGASGEAIAPRIASRVSNQHRKEKKTQALKRTSYIREANQAPSAPIHLEVERITLGGDTGASSPTPFPSVEPVYPVQEVASAAKEAEVQLPGTEAFKAMGAGEEGQHPSTSIGPTAVMPPLHQPQGSGRSEKAVCPQCYAENPPQNLFCQECGSPMPTVTPGATGAATMRSGATFYSRGTGTAQELSRRGEMAPSAREATRAMVPVEGVEGRERKKTFSFADVLAIFSLVTLGLALSPIFKWRKGMNVSIFGYQGVNRPGGPGILPYAGWEWLTLGVVTALALALTLAFLLIRVGRGNMFILAGWIALFPFIYLVAQSLLPLRTQGMELEKAVGFGKLFFGGGAYPYSLEPTVWLLVGGGVLLLLAGLLSPPRRWLRLVSLISFGATVGGLAIFCAMAYNWNIFIPEAVKLLGKPSIFL